MQGTRKRWIVVAVAAAVALAVAIPEARLGVAGPATSGQSSPHGVLRTDTAVPQVRQFYSAPSDLTPSAQRRPEREAPKSLTPIAAHGGPGEDGKPEHHSGGHGPGSGQDNGHGPGSGHGADAVTDQP